MRLGRLAFACLGLFGLGTGCFPDPDPVDEDGDVGVVDTADPQDSVATEVSDTTEPPTDTVVTDTTEPPTDTVTTDTEPPTDTVATDTAEPPTDTVTTDTAEPPTDTVTTDTVEPGETLVGCQLDPGSCDDGDACNGVESCGADGACLPGTAVVCTQGDDPCKISVCVPSTGTCEEVEESDTTPCDDGDPCTVTDLCDGTGACVGGTTLADAIGDWALVMGEGGGTNSAPPPVVAPSSDIVQFLQHSDDYEVFSTAFDFTAAATLTVPAGYITTVSSVRYGPLGGLVGTARVLNGGAGRLASLGAADTSAALVLTPSTGSLFGDGAGIDPDDTGKTPYVVGVGSHGILWKHRVGTADHDFVFCDPVASLPVATPRFAIVCSHRGPLAVPGTGQGETIIPAASLTDSYIAFDANGRRVAATTLVPSSQGTLGGGVVVDGGALLWGGLAADFSFSPASSAGVLTLPKPSPAFNDDILLLQIDDVGQPRWARAIAGPAATGVTVAKLSDGWLAATPIDGAVGLYAPTGLLWSASDSDPPGLAAMALIALDDHGGVRWGRRLPPGVVASSPIESGETIVWLTHVSETKNIDGLELATPSGQGRLYAVRAGANDGVAIDATLIATGTTSDALPLLGTLLHDGQGRMLVGGRLKSGGSLGPNTSKTFEVTTSSLGVALFRLNSGQALFCP